MASMKELFPLHVPKKIQRNFIRENIRNAKGCAQCIAEKKGAVDNPAMRLNTKSTPRASDCYAQKNTEIPSSLKYNVKLVKRERSSSRSKSSNSSDSSRVKLNNRGCQTDTRLSESTNIPITCENCGHCLQNSSNLLPPPLTTENENTTEIQDIPNEISDSNSKEHVTKDSHQLSHLNEEERREIFLKKLQNPASYKKGEVPRYLKERNAQLERDRQERETRKKLEQILGLNDPKCPLGHMLMPSDELERNLIEMETKYNSLIAELNRMPVSNDSFKIRQRTIQIEKELKELEERIELYRTKKVFVKIPELKLTDRYNMMKNEQLEK